MNQVTLMGRIVRDIETKTAQNGTTFARMTIAVPKNLSSEKKKEMASKNQPLADFIDCVLWGQTAEFAAAHTEKGARVLVEGSIQTGSYQKDGKKVYTTDVFVNRFTPVDWKGKEEQKTNPVPSMVEEASHRSLRSLVETASPEVTENQESFFGLDDAMDIDEERIPF